jgi:hypothetical protein
MIIKSNILANQGEMLIYGRLKGQKKIYKNPQCGIIKAADKNITII